MTTRGERLQRYLAEKTGGRRGWQTKLVEASGVKRQTITKWTNPKFDGYPDLEALAHVAAALGVPTSELVSALDGEGPKVALDDRLRTMIREEIERYGEDRELPRASRG